MLRIPVLICLVCLIGIIPAGAQPPTVRADVILGEKAGSSGGVFEEVIHTSDQAFYLLLSRQKQKYVQKLGPDMKKIYQKQIPTGMVDPYLSPTIVLLGDELLLFQQKYDSKANEKALWAQFFAEKNFAPRGVPAKVVGMSAKKSQDAGYYTARSTPDQEGLCVRYFVKDKKGRENTVTRYFDKSLNEAPDLAGTEPPQRVEPDVFTIEGRLHMKDGSLVVLSLQPQDKKGTKSHGAKDTPDETYVLTVFDKDDSIGRPYQIAVKERVLQDLAITEGDHGSILCEGLFGDPGSTRMRGTVFMRFDKSTGGMEAQKFYDLPTDLLTKGMSEKAREKVERAGDAPEFPAFEVRHVANLGDGTSLLVAEEYYSYEVTIRGQTAGGYDKTRFNSVFHNDDLIVVKFDADGNVIWSNKVIKTQHTTDADSDLSGVLVHVKGNRTFLLFNDHVANLSLKPGDHYKAYIPYGPESMTTLVTIEPDGQVLREALFGPDMLGYSFDLLRREHLPDGRLFIQAKDRSGQRFGMVTFK